MSGGDQQKVILARWLNIGVQVFLLDEPPRGIDAGSKHGLIGSCRGTCQIWGVSQPSEHGRISRTNLIAQEPVCRAHW